MLPFPEKMSVRPAGRADLVALRAFVARCSTHTLYRRFHGAADRPVQRELVRIATPTATHRSWVAVAPDGTVHGTATLAWSHTGTVEVAFLVEDAWQRRGIGRALFGSLAREAVASRVDAVVATLQADNVRAVRFLAAVAPGAHPRHVSGAEVEVTIRVPAGPACEEAA
jgi:GNAT superfamily N-acetyltransferase